MKKFISSLLFLLSASCMTVALAADEPTLKQKIGQMIIIGFKGMELKPEDLITQAILSQQIGGVILFDKDLQSNTYDRNIKSPEQVKQLTEQLQIYANQAAATYNNDLTPLFVSIDYEGGRVNRLKETYGFPKTLSQADIALLTPAQAEEYAKQMAATLKQAGINMNFAPVVDVNINPDSPAIGKLGRSYSADPQIVADYAAIFSKAYHEQNILCAYKHFPGHGSASGDTHTGFVDVTQTWKDIELEPYKKLFAEPDHCPIVMSAHVVNLNLDKQGYPASISHEVITELLRNRLNFDGLVVTDDMQMKAITEQYGLEDAIVLAVNAGADLLVFGNQLVPVPQDPQQIIEIIYQAVQAGKISEERINESYNRIMKLKVQLRLKPNL